MNSKAHDASRPGFAVAFQFSVYFGDMSLYGLDILCSSGTFVMLISWLFNWCYYIVLIYFGYFFLLYNWVFYG